MITRRAFFESTIGGAALLALAPSLAASDAAISPTAWAVPAELSSDTQLYVTYDEAQRILEECYDKVMEDYFDEDWP